MGNTVSISALGESVIFTAPGDNGGASWMFARSGKDTFHFSQQGSKWAVGSNSAAISANGNELGIVKNTLIASDGASPTNLNLYSEIVYMRVKIKVSSSRYIQ